jgi:hypothetical protein
MESSFETNPLYLDQLLTQCHTGQLKLPDFQRSWVWDEDRIRSLIASVSRGFPVGALMTLRTGGSVNFKPRCVEGAPVQSQQTPHDALLLDGQQRMTSLYQATIRRQVVNTVTPKNKHVKRWFYIDMLAALDSSVDRDEAIVGVPGDKRLTSNFGREIDLDLSSDLLEYKHLMYPVSQVFNWDVWQDGFDDYWRELDPGKRALFREFKKQVLENFKRYQVPVIALGKDTTKEAVCTVFEKVNTGGKPLDAFELVTATFAAEGYELRKDWYGDGETKGIHARLREACRAPGTDAGILAEVANTDLLQVISLFHTRELREAAREDGKSGKELPQVTGARHALLNLPLNAYKKYVALVERGFLEAGKFLYELHLYRTFDLPYQSQVVPLAAILANVPDALDHDAHRAKLTRWYWCGVFGELYGSTVETRVAKDFTEVPAWLDGGSEPSTVADAVFQADRLKTMRMRLSAAYKGVNALLMQKGARDWRSGKRFDHSAFFGEGIDIHHIFPQTWCKSQGITKSEYDSIINKTPLSYKTNRVIGGDAPSVYLSRLEHGKGGAPHVEKAKLEEYLESHLVDAQHLRGDNFREFMAVRQGRLLALIEEAMGRSAYPGTEDVAEDFDEEESEIERLLD